LILKHTDFLFDDKVKNEINKHDNAEDKLLLKLNVLRKVFNL